MASTANPTDDYYYAVEYERGGHQSKAPTYYLFMLKSERDAWADDGPISFTARGYRSRALSPPKGARVIAFVRDEVGYYYAQPKLDNKGGA